MKRPTWVAVFGALLIGLLVVAPVHAAPIITPTVTLSGGVYQYDYEVFNVQGLGTDRIFDFMVEFDGWPYDWPTGSPQISSPAGWDWLAGEGFVEWMSMDPSFDIAPETALTGFSFRSLFGPGPADYLAVYSDSGGAPTGGFDSGITVAPIPEPATLLLVAAGLAGALARKRRT